MKGLCITLLVANALFLGWRVNERLYGPPDAAPGEVSVPPLPPDAPALTLLSEAAETPEPRVDDRTPAGDAAAGQPPSEASPETPAAESAASTEPTPASVDGADAKPPAPAPTTPDVPAPVAELAGPHPPGPPPAAKPDAVTGAPTGVVPTPATEVADRPAAAEAAPQDGAAVTTVAAAEPPRPTMLCATIGPFQTSDAQRAAERRLTAQVERIDGRSQSAREAKMFTVFLEPTGTEAEAEKRLDELKNKGITDYFLIRRGEMRNAIQVGTFRSQESVTKRLAELERSGYKAVVVPKSEAGAQKYWLDVVYDKERQSLRSLKALAGEGARAIRADCPR